MLQQHLPATRPPLVTLLLACGVFAGLARFGTPLASAQAADLRAATPNEKAWKDLQYQESGTCALCHAGPTALNKGQGSLDFVLMAEYSIWKTHDKHAQAYAVLEGKRGKQMAGILGVDVTAPAAGCLNCHAMANLAAGQVSINKFDGVSCGGCHGPSSGWIGPHSSPALWRVKTPEEKFKAGLRDLRDPVVRAELCYSCHIGKADEGKVVTHAMFAAGHPPLPPIDLANFSRNEPQHWRDAKDVPYFAADYPRDKDPAKLSYATKVQNYHLKDKDYLRTKFAMVGAAVALRETMRLTADRAEADPKTPKVLWPELLLGLDQAKLPGDGTVKAEFKSRWPEIAMATSDCFACHHDLKYPGFRQLRGTGFILSSQVRIPARPGRPLIRMWPTALMETDTGGGDSFKEFESKLKNLATACDARPFGEPEQIRNAAHGLESWADSVAKKIAGQPITRDSDLRLMRELCALFDSRNGKQWPLVPDYEAAKQIAGLLAVVYEDYRGKAAADPKIGDILARLSDELNLRPFIRREERGKVILDVIRQLTNSSDAKSADELSAFVKSLGDRTVDQAKLDALISNPFLNLLRTSIDPKKFTDELIKNQVVIDKLQKFSDEEEINTLRRVADYDPYLFKANLKALAKMLPES